MGTLGRVSRFAKSEVSVAERIVAVGLLTERDLRLLGSNFDRVWPVDESTCFSELLEAIDEAERATRATSTKVAELPEQQKSD